MSEQQTIGFVKYTWANHNTLPLFNLFISWSEYICWTEKIT